MIKEKFSESFSTQYLSTVDKHFHLIKYKQIHKHSKHKQTQKHKASNFFNSSIRHSKYKPKWKKTNWNQNRKKLQSLIFPIVSWQPNLKTNLFFCFVDKRRRWRNTLYQRSKVSLLYVKTLTDRVDWTT